MVGIIFTREAIVDYDAIKITIEKESTHVHFLKDDKIVGSVDRTTFLLLSPGDTLTLTGLEGKIRIGGNKI